MKGVETNELVQKPGIFFIRAIAQDYLRSIPVSFLHFLDPEFCSGNAIRICQQNDLIQGFFDAHAEGIFFPRDADGFVFEIDDMKTLEFLFKFIEEIAGLVLAVMIHDHDLMRRGVVLNKRAKEMSFETGCFIAGADNDAYGMGLGMLFWRRDIKGETSKEPTVVKQLNYGNEAKNNKKQFEPGETPKQFSHKCILSGACLMGHADAKVRIFRNVSVKERLVRGFT